MAIYYSKTVEFESYRKQLLADLRNANQEILRNYGMAELHTHDFEMQQLDNEAQIGTAWFIPLQLKEGNFIYLIPAERISPNGHQVTVTVQCCHATDGSQENLYRWLLHENVKLPLGLRYNVQDDIVSVDFAFIKTHFLSSKMLATMLLAAVKLSEDTFTHFSRNEIQFKPLLDSEYQATLPDVGEIPERIQKYVRRLN